MDSSKAKQLLEQQWQPKAKKDQSMVTQNPSPNLKNPNPSLDFPNSLHSDNPSPSSEANGLLVNPSLPNPIPSRERVVPSGLGNLEKQAIPSYKEIQDD
ncbi:hypothetical protein ACH5RR_033710 [Cinchona calisaya]|uniref:Uncharacterized protein n=1 Tax=Cinchona calisaya TaxID=153742 RepID=A0ABD2YCM8_9GENT